MPKAFVVEPGPDLIAGFVESILQRRSAISIPFIGVQQLL